MITLAQQTQREQPDRRLFSKKVTILLVAVAVIAGIVVIAMEWKNWARFLRRHTIQYPYFPMACKQVSVILFGIVFVILSALVMIV